MNRFLPAVFSRSTIRAFELRSQLRLSSAWSHRGFSSSHSVSFPVDRSKPSIGPIGVQAALKAANDASFTPRRTLLSHEFSLSNRVAIVTGGQRGLGLEMAAALA